MRKQITFLFLLILFSLGSFAQSTVVEGKQIKAADSLKIGSNWVKKIVTDTSLTNVTDRDLPSALSVKKNIYSKVVWDTIRNKPINFPTTYAMGNDIPDSILTALKLRDSSLYLTPSKGDAIYVRIQTQNPNAALSGGFSYERHAAGTFTSTLSYSAGRLAAGTGVNATNPLSSIVVASITESFSQPSAGSSVSGTQSVTVTYNTNTSFTNTVTTLDSKTASASTSFTVFDKRYVGWAATSTPTSAEILAAVYQDNSGGNASINTTLSVLVTAKYLFIVNTVNESSITVNGFPSTSAFSLNNSISFTNASGGTFTGKYTISNAPIGNAGSTSLIIN